MNQTKTYGLRASLGIAALVLIICGASTSRAFELITNEVNLPVKWRSFPQTVEVYGETSDGLTSEAAQDLMQSAFDDWADEGCFPTEVTVTAASGTGWASGNGKNETAWVTGDTANFDPYRPTLGDAAEGSDCNQDADCASGICDGSPAKCVVPGATADGGECMENSDCASWVCAETCEPRSVVLGITIAIYPLRAEPNSMLEADIVLNETASGLDYSASDNADEIYTVVAHQAGHCTRSHSVQQTR